MKKFFKNQVVIAILIGSILITAGIIIFAYIGKNNNSAESKSALLNAVINGDSNFSGEAFQDNEYILGNKKNDITLVVYSDFECPFCKMLQEETIQKLEKEYSLSDSDYTKSKISIVYRHFALSFHDKAPTEANASLCTRELYGQNAYIGFINRIYNITPANNGLDLSLLPDIAKFAVESAQSANKKVTKDFDLNEFTSCLSNLTYNNEFQNNYQDAVNAGIDGTPYTLILYKNKDSEVIVQKISGARDFAYFKNIIDKLLKIK